MYDSASRPALPNADTRQPVPLSSLGRGCRATVCHRSIPGDDQELLTAMGLGHRCRLRVCRAGEPCIIQVAATRLGLSATLARRVLVLPAGGREQVATGSPP